MAFQPTGFQPLGFQMNPIFARRDLTINFKRVVVYHHIRFTQPMNSIRAGSLIHIAVEIFDNTIVPRVLINPNTSVLLTVFNPEGITYLDNQAMFNQSLGTYFLNVQTAISDTLGLYYGRVAVNHAGGISYNRETGLFVLTLD